MLALDYRRESADIIFLIKITSRHIDCPEPLSRIDFNVPKRIFRNIKPISLPFARTNYRQNSYLLRAGKCLNAACECFDIDLFNSNSESEWACSMVL
jgi:hypothetical protein